MTRDASSGGPLVLSPEQMARATEVAAATPSSRLLVRTPFVSWHGTATLAFAGFSRSLLDLKRRLSQHIELAPENSGSRWPKCTLGYVRDGVTLQIEQVRTLRRLCDRAANALETEAAAIEVSALAVIVFDCRSVERVAARHLVQLAPPSHQDETPPASHRRLVADVLDEFSWPRLEQYLPRLQLSGSREAHYRGPARESTIVCEIAQLPRAVNEFRTAVDEQLPGVYRWFEPASWHVTIRALVPASGG